MKRQRISFATLFRFIGVMAKFLFVGIFIATVLCILMVALGSQDIALRLYTIVWNLFWRTGLTLFSALSILIVWKAL
ncbi:MAG: hypothetical protein F6K42_08090 [Leptolyngbya sp. SIO1D8]|nr:hypothetical protein [Leptolyngbya sp. SIO1D8]